MIWIANIFLIPMFLVALFYLIYLVLIFLGINIMLVAGSIAFMPIIFFVLHKNLPDYSAEQIIAFILVMSAMFCIIFSIMLR